MLLICSRSLRGVSDIAAISWQWGFFCLGSIRPMVVSAADFRVPFSKSHSWLADIFGLTSCSDCCSGRVSLMVAARFHSRRSTGGSSRVELLCRRWSLA